MNKNKLLFAAAAMFFSAILHAEPAKITRIDEDKKAVKYNQKVDGFKDVTVVKGKNCTKQYPLSVSLAQYENQELNLYISGDLKISGADETYDLIWMINDFDAGFPELTKSKIKADTWTHFEGRTVYCCGKNKQLFLSKTGFPVNDLTFYLKNFTVRVETEGDLGAKESWLDVPSLKNAYKDYFSIGLAVTFKGELNNPDIQDGITRHAESITLGNAFKPDFLFAWQDPTAKLTTYTDSTGKTIQVPALLPKFNDMDQILNIARMNNLKIRGHVLTWHSQTPHWFFTEGFSRDKDAKLVDKETMTARHEWYIKSVLEHVTAWEEKYNKGKHVIWVWDVVNEAAADNAGPNRYLREQSDWYSVYGDSTFIVNAFRFANKYAPSDVLLCYNDYGTYSGSNQKSGKHGAILHIIDDIQANPETRLDVMGMQSHMNMDYPKITGADSFETAVKNFTAKGLDVHVTEIDIGHKTAYSPIRMKDRYTKFFEMFLNNRGTEEKKGITNVTIWGLTDESTWLDNQAEYKNKIKQHPVLFEGKVPFTAKPCFYGVLEAVENYSSDK